MGYLLVGSNLTWACHIKLVRDMNTLKITRKEKYVICEIDNGKVNAIDIELSRDLKTFFEAAELDDQIEGVILTGRPHCFSAGLDIMKLSSGGPKGAEAFWRTNLAALQAMVRFSKPFIAAITGYAPAAGTILACTADYRIMGYGEKHVMGMHELKLSLVIPELYIRIFSHWIGDKNAMECILHSRLMQAEAAKSIGLVNETCVVDEVLPRAETLMQRWTDSYINSTRMTKSFLKKGFVEKMNLDMEEMIKDILKSSFDPVVIERFIAFATKVKNKK